MITPESPVTTAAENLHRLLSRCLKSPAAGDEPVLVSTTTAVPALDPLLVFRQACGQKRAFWERAVDGFALVAVGAAAELVGDGDDRCSQVARAWHRLGSRALVETADGYPLHAPVSVGGLAFDAGRTRDRDWADYPDALFLLPRLLFTWSGGACWLTINVVGSSATAKDAVVGETTAMLSMLLTNDGSSRASTLRGGVPRDRGGPYGGRHDEKMSAMTLAPALPPLDPEAEDDGDARLWKDTIRTILEDIQRGAVEKQVLARCVRLGTRAALDPACMLHRLRRGYGPSCTVFAVTRGDTCFLGASPERLVRVDGHAVRADALAGSTARGSTADEDSALGSALLASSKERHEHALVVRALHDQLEPLCKRLSVPQEPILLGMPNVQHLHTPVEGVLRASGNILDLVERLHPTPTVGGVPRKAILSRIRAFEPFDRGWYAGPVGWIDAHDDGEFAVAIRSALVKATGARQAPATVADCESAGNYQGEVLIYAGCGIVAGSDPDAEHRESCMKLGALLWAVKGPPGAQEHPGAPMIEWPACSEA